VHVRDEFPLPFNLLATLFLGLPFDGYRVHHFNHHTYANDLNDFSTTWFEKNGKKRGFTPCQYTFGWLRQLSRSIREPNPFDESLGDVTKIKARIEPQKITLFLFCILLAFIGLKAFILYFMLVYFGWAFSALHNYGQHPPITKEPVCTYANKSYNSLFFNNGLHWEHHDKPWLSWNQLELDKDSQLISHPHLIEPCVARRNK
jgi:fatty acid desaturase